MSKRLITTICSIIILFFFMRQTAFAVVNNLGDLANNILVPTVGLGRVFSAICYVAGAGILVAAAFQYSTHRRNPTQVRLSTPVFLLILGAVLICVPLLARLSQAAPIADQYYTEPDQS